ncbi:glycoside hydrolase family 2 TIM barrel-domain containing protein [Victivallis vadensis]|uniref:glycoside hydrolase family 2 TIM barrel-domain containing protein n=1 Tax=Victivallis vadensis TaxID=172901 RepID=UPI0026DC4105|nr:glycoside hydrolase family 2 TIM barrel-domain containing protein [Victivallis vadensis]
MMKKLLFTALAALTAAGLSAAERLEIPPRFQAQPATSANQPPKADAWSTNRVTTLGHALPPAGAGWKRADAKKIHNQYLKREFEVPSGWNSGRLSLDFERINGNAVIFINGKKVGERLGPYGEIDITGFAVPGEKNELLIFNTRNYTDVSRTFENDPLRYTARGPKALYGAVPMERWAFGVDAPVWLVHRPDPAAIAAAWSDTSFRKKTVTMHAELDARQPVRDAKLQVEIFDADGKKVLEFAREGLTLKPGIQNVETSAPWANPRLWELDGGYVYTAKLTLADSSGKVIDRESFPFGFREVWTEGRNLMLNGHKARFRVEWSSFGLNENSVSYFKLLGRNMIYFQSNPSGWWRDWGGEVFNFPQETLDLCDREGIAVLLPVPTVNFGRERLLNDPVMKKQYKEETEAFMRRYRNHPSILAWCLSMNSFNPKDAIHPPTMGKRSDYRHVQADVLENAAKLVKSYDPTRLAYSHADGNLTDLATGNCYPNFAPIQEAEDWPEIWSKEGDMPWWACEFAAVYDGSYFKGKQFLLTEYAAIMLGPEAYKLETDKQLEETVRLGLNNRGHGQDMRHVAQYTPLYYEVQKRYVEAMDRAWRTYGVLGWHYFNFHLGYGDPPETKGYKPFARYSVMTRPVTGRPDWANPQFDYYAKNMQPLLAYVAGYPDHTDKTHSFYAGETVEKQLAAVWDGPGDLKLTGKWELLDAQGNAVLSGKLGGLDLKAGDIKFEPVRFTAPAVARRSEYHLKLTLDGWKDKPLVDTFALEIFPKTEPVGTARAYRLYDPQNRSGWVKELVPDVKPLASGEKPGVNDVVIFGRESLKVGDKLPFTADDIRNGLKVVFLEQMPEVWEAMGLRNYEAAPRQVFPTMKQLNLREADLRDWRGKATLLPEFKAARAYDVPVAPKTSNRGVVASTVMEIPQAVGFLPLLACEFDMNYSPLLEYRDGKGGILYSSLDFTGRAGKDPAATELAAWMLKRIGAETAPRKTKVFLNLPPEELAKRGIRTEPAKLRRAFTPDDRIGELLPLNLLRFRDELACNRIVSGRPGDEIMGNGMFLFRPESEELYCQLAPELLEGRYADDPDRKESVAISVVRLKQLAARLKTLGGEAPAPGTTERLLKVRRGAAYQNLDSWTVFGPFYAKTNDAAKALAKEYPGQKAALAGDTNPNITYPTGDGRTLDFRTTVSAGPDGFVDLGRILKPAGLDAVAFAVKEIESPVERRAMLRFGADYFFRIYVNGKPVYEQSTNHSSPKPNQFKVRVKLKKGVNVIVVKLMCGSKGFGFWANLSEPEGEGEVAEPAAKELLYDPNIKIRSPYEYHYW